MNENCMSESITNKDADFGATIGSFIYTWAIVFVFILLTAPPYGNPSSSIIPQIFSINVIVRIYLAFLIYNNFKGLSQIVTSPIKDPMFVKIINGLKGFIFTSTFMVLFFTDAYLFDRIGFKYLFYVLPILATMGIFPMMQFWKIRKQIMDNNQPTIED